MPEEVEFVTDCISCSPSYSFYFDFIPLVFKAPKSDRAPIHRLCTLARKMGAKCVVMEKTPQRIDITKEIEKVEKHFGKPGKVRIFSISFFTCEAFDYRAADRVQADALIGTFIIINYGHKLSKDYICSYIYEAIFPQPRLAPHPGTATIGLLNNFIVSSNKFIRIILERTFELSGVYYCQQNFETSGCVHSSLRMVLNSIPNHHQQIAPYEINQAVCDEVKHTNLQLSQVSSLISRFGKIPVITDCKNVSRGKDKGIYISVLASVLESGLPALLTINTQHNTQHVINICGYTRNTDEWHPEALPAYKNRKGRKYYSSSSWIDHFIIHDDNFGPYYTLNCHVLETDPNITAQSIIALYPTSVSTVPCFIQHNAISLLEKVLESRFLDNIMVKIKNRWLSFLSEEDTSLVLRTILIKKSDYISHLLSSKSHDGTKLSNRDIILFEDLPEMFWITEISVPHVFIGNYSKVGEIISRMDIKITEEETNPWKVCHGIRLPGCYIAIRSGGHVDLAAVSLTSHSPIYMVAHAHHEW